MKESPIGSLVRRLVKAVGTVGDAVSRGLGALVEGTAPAPQLVPVRVRQTRRRS